MPPSAAIDSNPNRLTSSSKMRRWAGSSSTISMREVMLFNQLIVKGPNSGTAYNRHPPMRVCFAFPVIRTLAVKGKGPVNEVDYLGTNSACCRNCGHEPYGKQIINKEWT
jgi:hypothetical protein